MTIYFVGIRALGKPDYLITSDTTEPLFHKWFEVAAYISKKIGIKCFVDFRQKAFTFEVDATGEKTKTHFMSPSTEPIDPALSALSDGG